VIFNVLGLYNTQPLTLTIMKTAKFILVLLLVFNCIHVFGQFQTEPNNQRKYNEKEAKEEVEKIYGRLLAGETMEDMAEMISQDPGTFLRGGILGLVNPVNNYVDSFVLAIENLKIDEVSKPFRTDFGYHVAKVLLKKKDKMLIQHVLIRVQE
jgi:PPIC-type PPIASE domain